MECQRVGWDPDFTGISRGGGTCGPQVSSKMAKNKDLSEVHLHPSEFNKCRVPPLWLWLLSAPLSSVPIPTCETYRYPDRVRRPWVLLLPRMATACV